MGIIKKQYSDYTERVENTVDRVVDSMNVEDLVKYAASSLKDYYINVASREEVEQLLYDNRPL
jgi:hypothetical protein|tara:strand:- start:445 stop:633 length:189 start_codon:yes stop_codon:yes gene_type:complete